MHAKASDICVMSMMQTLQEVGSRTIHLCEMWEEVNIPEGQCSVDQEQTCLGYNVSREEEEDEVDADD